MSELHSQVGGDHYKQFSIQPVEFSIKNRLGFVEGSVVKYICRHRDKGGREDLEKAAHYLRLLIEIEYGTETEECKGIDSAKKRKHG